MITELARVRSLVVRPSSVIVKYQGSSSTRGDMGRELSVDAILTAGFLHAGEHFRVTAQLLDVGTGEILWSDRIDADASDIIAVQDTIVQHIVDGLRIELSPDEKVGLAKGSTTNAAAYEEYLRGRDCLARFIYHTISRARSRFGDRAFRARDRTGSEFCARPFRVGRLLRQSRAQRAWAEPKIMKKRKNAFNKALAIDPKLLEARMQMVFIYLSRRSKAESSRGS